MPSGLSFGSAVNNSLVFYRIKVPTIQIRSLSQKALIWFLSSFWGAAALSDRTPHVPLQSWSHQPLCERRRFHGDLLALLLCGVSTIYIYICICLHINAYICLPFICLTSRERWKLFLRVRHDHIGITLQHSVFAYHVSSIFRKKSTLWPFKKPSIIMKWNTVISFIRSFFSINLQHALPKPNCLYKSQNWYDTFPLNCHTQGSNSCRV